MKRKNDENSPINEDASTGDSIIPYAIGFV